MTENDARSFVNARTNAVGLGKLERLVDLLAEENSAQNLVSADSFEIVWNRHIADSAQLIDHVPRETGIWLDLGSGAGFPGLVIAVMRPKMQVHLVESRAKRADWLSSAIAALEVDNCQVDHCRLERLDPIEAEVISARAFAPLDKLLRLSAGFSTDTTTWVLPKGRSAEQELCELPSSVQRMFHVKQSATDEAAAVLVGFGKPSVLGQKGATR